MEIPGQMTIEDELRRQELEAAVSDLHRFGWYPLKGCSCETCEGCNGR